MQSNLAAIFLLGNRGGLNKDETGGKLIQDYSVQSGIPMLTHCFFMENVIPQRIFVGSFETS